MKNLNKTLAIAAFAAISMFSAQTVNAEPVNGKIVTTVKTTPESSGNAIDEFFHSISKKITDWMGITEFPQVPMWPF